MGTAETPTPLLGLPLQEHPCEGVAFSVMLRTMRKKLPKTNDDLTGEQDMSTAKAWCRLVEEAKSNCATAAAAGLLLPLGAVGVLFEKVMEAKNPEFGRVHVGAAEPVAETLVTCTPSLHLRKQSPTVHAFFHVKCQHRFERSRGGVKLSCNKCVDKGRKRISGRMLTAVGPVHKKTTFNRILQQSSRAVRNKLVSDAATKKDLKRRCKALCQAKASSDAEAKIAASVACAVEHLHNDKGEKLLDVHLPKGSLQRQLWDQNQANMKSYLQSGGSRRGMTHSKQIHRLGLSLLLKCHRSAYEALAQLFPCLPSLSAMQRCKNFLPEKESGPLATQLNAMMFEMKRCDDWSKRGSLSIDACRVARDMQWNPDHTVFSGLSDDPHHLSVVKAQFQAECARKTQGEPATTAGKPNKRKQHDQVEFASQYLVMHWTSCGGKHQFPVARYAINAEQASSLHRMVQDVMYELRIFGLRTVALVCDGASVNRAMANDMLSVPASRWFTDDVMEQYAEMDFSVKVAFEWLGDAVFIMFDPPHWVSRLGRACLLVCRAGAWCLLVVLLYP